MCAEKLKALALMKEGGAVEKFYSEDLKTDLFVKVLTAGDIRRIRNECDSKKVDYSDAILVESILDEDGKQIFTLEEVSGMRLSVYSAFDKAVSKVNNLEPGK